MMEPRPIIPEATEILGDETLIGRQGMKLRRFPMAIIRKWMGPSIVRAKSSATGLSGDAQIVFPKAFREVPEVWVTPQIQIKGAETRLIIGVPSQVTKTGCVITVFQTKGTFLIGTSPIEIASGVTVEAVAFGNLA